MIWSWSRALGLPIAASLAAAVDAYRLQRLLGYERDDGHNLCRVASEGRGT